MEKLSFNFKHDYLDFIEGLVGRDIMEIAKIGKDEYTFRIDNKWYNLSNRLIGGTTFSLGPSFMLKGGYDLNNLGILYSEQFRQEPRVNRVLSKLDEAYIKFIAIQNDRSKEIIKNLFEFLDECESIEKFSDNFLIVNKQKCRYSFAKEENLTNGRYFNKITVKRICGDKEHIVRTITGDFHVHSIMTFLKFIYYTSRIEYIDEIRNIIDESMI